MGEHKSLPGYEWVAEHARTVYRATGLPLVVSPEVCRIVFGRSPTPRPLPPEAAEAVRRAFEDAR